MYMETSATKPAKQGFAYDKPATLAEHAAKGTFPYDVPVRIACDEGNEGN